MPPPKAKSQGSKAGGGGALTAFTRRSAAKAEPDTNASAVANKASFFMTIPITLLGSPASAPPRASDNRPRPNVLTWSHIGVRHHDREAKKASMCRLFRRSGRFDKCCPRVLHSHNNFGGLGAAGRNANRKKQAIGDAPEGAFCESNSP